MEEARKMLSNYIATVTRRALKLIREQTKNNEQLVLAQVKACNEMITDMWGGGRFSDSDITSYAAEEIRPLIDILNDNGYK